MSDIDAAVFVYMLQGPSFFSRAILWFSHSVSKEYWMWKVIEEFNYMEYVSSFKRWLTFCGFYLEQPILVMIEQLEGQLIET